MRNSNDNIDVSEDSWCCVVDSPMNRKDLPKRAFDVVRNLKKDYASFVSRPGSRVSLDKTVPDAVALVHPRELRARSCAAKPADSLLCDWMKMLPLNLEIRSPAVNDGYLDKRINSIRYRVKELVYGPVFPRNAEIEYL